MKHIFYTSVRKEALAPQPTNLSSRMGCKDFPRERRTLLSLVAMPAFFFARLALRLQACNAELAKMMRKKHFTKTLQPKAAAPLKARSAPHRKKRRRFCSKGVNTTVAALSRCHSLPPCPEKRHIPRANIRSHRPDALLMCPRHPFAPRCMHKNCRP